MGKEIKELCTACSVPVLGKLHITLIWEGDCFVHGNYCHIFISQLQVHSVSPRAQKVVSKRSNQAQSLTVMVTRTKHICAQRYLDSSQFYMYGLHVWRQFIFSHPFSSSHIHPRKHMNMLADSFFKVK